MGNWSTTIFGNDYVADLLPEFKAVFSKYDDETAIALLKDYESKNVRVEDKHDFLYALSLFLWQNGRLTDEIKRQALDAIKLDDLSLYNEADESILKNRKKALSELALKLQMPQPKRKKIKTDLLRIPLFEIGDVVALKLQCLNKYILIQCVAKQTCFQSKIDKSLQGSYPHFALLKYYSEKIPNIETIKDIEVATYLYDYCEYCLKGKKPIAIEKVEKRKYFFYCEWKERPFKLRKFEVLGNFPLCTQHEKYGTDLDFCNLWREKDELQLEKCVMSQLRLHAYWQGPTNENAIEWLKTRNQEIYDLWQEYHNLYYQGALPQNQSFVAYVKSLGYWNDDLK